METRQALERAVAHHNAGRLNEAEQLYRQVLASNPSEPDALHLLGVIALQVGKLDTAAELVAQAVATRETAEFRANLGEIERRRGSGAAAILHLERALEIKPGLTQAYNSLVSVALRKGTRPQLGPAVLQPPPLLWRLQIEITTWCNLRCAGCPRTIGIEKGSWANRHMSREDFSLLVECMPPSMAVCLQGVGESTLHPEFRDLVAIARASGKYRAITLNTNALARDLAYYERLQEAGVTSISVSVDSLAQEIADVCRYGTLVDKLRSRLSDLARRIDNITVSVVLSRRNLEDLPHTLAVLDGIGLRSVEVQPLIDYGGEATGDWTLGTADVTRARQILDDARRRLPNLTISSVGPIGDDSVEQRCARPFFAPFVTVEGFLTPCCTAQDPALLGHTSVLRQTFAEAWRSAPVQDWLARYLAATPEICVGCCFYSGD